MVSSAGRHPSVTLVLGQEDCRFSNVLYIFRRGGEVELGGDGYWQRSQREFAVSLFVGGDDCSRIRIGICR